MCDCLERVQSRLKRDHPEQRLETAFSLTTGEQKPVLSVIRSGRKKPLLVLPNNCPFCGEQYSKKAQEKGVTNV